MPQGGSSAASRSFGTAATSTSRTAPPGSGRRPSATTRTGSSSARTGCRPISRPTSGTWRRSSAAASTSSSTSGARITTAPSRGSGTLRAALGFDREAVQMILIAWVRFIRDGQEIGSSKRSGEFITLDELLREIGADAARWFFGARATSTGIDFDLELATPPVEREPGLLRPVRPRPLRVDPAPRGRAVHRCRRDPWRRAPPPSGRAGAHPPHDCPARGADRCGRAP